MRKNQKTFRGYRTFSVEGVDDCMAWQVAAGTITAILRRMSGQEPEPF
jgi:hypothetical protein